MQQPLARRSLTPSDILVLLMKLRAIVGLTLSKNSSGEWLDMSQYKYTAFFL